MSGHLTILRGTGVFQRLVYDFRVEIGAAKSVSSGPNPSQHSWKMTGLSKCRAVPFLLRTLMKPVALPVCCYYSSGSLVMFRSCEPDGSCQVDSTGENHDCGIWAIQVSEWKGAQCVRLKMPVEFAYGFCSPSVPSCWTCSWAITRCATPSMQAASGVGSPLLFFSIFFIQVYYWGRSRKESEGGIWEKLDPQGKKDPESTGWLAGWLGLGWREWVRSSGSADAREGYALEGRYSH